LLAEGEKKKGGWDTGLREKEGGPPQPKKTKSCDTLLHEKKMLQGTQQKKKSEQKAPVKEQRLGLS